MVTKGNLFVIVAPAGAGKTTLVNKLLEKTKNLVLSISHTTRPMRSREKQNVNYFFIDENEFEIMIENNDFLEYAKVFGNFYGTSKKWVEQELAQGMDVILEIDWQGAKQIKAQFPGCVAIFILPPSIDTLRERLHRRKQDDENVINRRISEAKIEISHHDECDYIIVNSHFQTALIQLRAIITAERQRVTRQINEQHDLLDSLLES